MNKDNFLLIQLSRQELSELIDKSVLSAIIKKDRIREHSDEILNAKQAAELLDISLPTLHKWKKAGQIPYYQKDGRIFFKRNELIKSI